MKRKQETINAIIVSVLIIIIVVGIGILILKDISDIPFKLCENKKGLVIDTKQDYIWYDCDKVNNITMSLSMVS